ncbi:MAG: nucleotidyltransferase domain-containing protein [Candidatus Omnitrophota bacterium]
MNEHLKQLIDKIEQTFHPVSVFLYGSRARVDFLERSDYEIGVLFKRGKEISRPDLKAINPLSSVNLYPFEYEDFLKYKLDTPFPEVVYFRELISGGKTLRGDKIIEKMKAPSIRVLDLMDVVRFNTGYALAAVLSHRRSDKITASIEFVKSCLFGIRCLVILKQKKFPLTYDEIFSASQDLQLDKEYSDVIEHAMNVRRGEKLQELYLYRNISLLNKIVKSEVKDVFEKNGNQTILE